MQSEDLKPDIACHPSHDMVYAPCLFLECENCLLSAKHNASELLEPCAEDAFFTK
jgi:hypothetical protein